MSPSDPSRPGGISVRSVAAQTGLSPHVLRNWERRYGVVHPERDRNGRRRYSAEDVERLRVLADAARQGHRIGDLVGLAIDEVRDLVASARAPAWRQQAETIAGRLLDAVRGSSPQECLRTLEFADAVLIPEHLAENVISPVLHRVGDAWQRNDVAIVQEHMFSELVRQSLLARIQRFNDVAQGPVVAFATLAGERHVFGALMAALIGAVRGYRVVLFGSGMPAAEIARGAYETGAGAIGVSVPVRRRENADELARLAASLDSQIQIWLGGEGAAALTKRELPRGCKVFERASQIEPAFARSIPIRSRRQHSGHEGTS